MKAKTIILIIAVIAVVASVPALLVRVREKSIDREPYMAANDEYAEGLTLYGKGSYREAREKFLGALKLQSVAADQAVAGFPPYRANLVTHNSAAYLAAIGAKTGDCGSYWKYRGWTEQLARAGWTYTITDDTVSQDDTRDSKLRKIEVIRDAAGLILSQEYACPRGEARGGTQSLPLGRPGAGDEKAR